MNPILAAIQAYLEQMVQGVAQSLATWLVNWFKQHVLPQAHMQGLAKDQVRAQARQWVHDMLAELGQDLVSKNLVPVWAQGFLPTLETLVEQAVDSALDAAGL